MANIGRNDPCPCGSGKKYKKCCEGKASTPARSPGPLSPLAPPQGPFDEDNLDELSNGVLDLIDQQRFDEALTLCDRLRMEFPEAIDWLDRSAMVHEARGDFALACDFYRRALAFTELPDQRDCFEDEGRAYFRTKVSELEGKLRSP
jgi:tetratricopeptide (TPR) repeat protein